MTEAPMSRTVLLWNIGRLGGCATEEQIVERCGRVDRLKWKLRAASKSGELVLTPDGWKLTVKGIGRIS